MCATSPTSLGGRAMVRAIDRQTTTPRRTHLGLRAGKRHPRLDHHLESGPQTIRLDQDRRRHPRTTRVISSSNSWRNTPGALVLRQPAGQSELGMSPSVRIYRRIDFILGAGAGRARGACRDCPRGTKRESTERRCWWTSPQTGHEELRSAQHRRRSRCAESGAIR